MAVPRYDNGSEVRIGDQIDYAGQPGTVVFVIDTRSFSDSFPESDWSFLNQGFMMDVNGMGLVHLMEADEDLQLVARSSS